MKATAPSEAMSAAAPPPRGREPWVAAAMRAVVHAVTLAVFAWPLARPEAACVAAAGAATGSLLGPRLARSTARTPVLLAGAAGAALLTVMLRQLVVDTSVLSPVLGPARALRLGDALLLGAGALCVSTTLRLLSRRRPALAVLEAALVAVAFAQLVVAHRHGAINRPFAIADPIIAAGGDPTFAFLAIGALATGVIVLLLLSERSPWRALLHVAVVGGILLLVLGTTRMLGLPPPPPSGGGLGLRAEEERDDSDGRSQGGQGSRSRRNNEQMEFRDDYDNSGQQAPVAIVVFHDDYSPPSGVYYFRQGAFSQYNGRRLVAATREDVDRDIASGFPTEPVRIEAAPGASSVRDTVEQTVALMAQHTRPFGLEAPVRLEPASNPDTGRFKRTYRAVSAVTSVGYRTMLGAGAGDTEWSEAQWSHYTEAPEDPRYAELAERVVHERLPEQHRDDPAARAIAVVSWLSEQGTYSLKSKHADADDPTAHFLFGDLTGYCVHFAHAATYMLRSLGVPARVATGYAVDESARQGGSALLLSGQNSHAWPEVHLDGYGWVVFDVSPERVLSPPPQPPDADLQRLLGELARGQNALPADASPSLPQMLDDARGLGRQLLIGLAALLIAALVVLFAGKSWRRVAPRFARETSLSRLAYRAELDRLSELACRRRPGESREAFAARMRAVAPSFVGLTAAHLAPAFGSRRARGPDQLRALARATQTEVRRAFPWWRRALGLFIPWSWLRSR